MTTPLTPPLDLIDNAVLTLLKTGRPADTVWDAVYAGSPTAPVYPYDILYPLAGGSADPFPSLDDRNDELTLPYQVSSVSNLRNGARFRARQSRDLLIGRTAQGEYATPLVLPAGWQCIRRAPDPAVPGVNRSGEHPNAIFTVPARYLLTIAPTA